MTRKTAVEPDTTPVETEVPAKKATAADDAPKGLHFAAERDVRVDDYPERSYKDAMTKEQREALKDAGLL